jgi:hypothetical protein
VNPKALAQRRAICGHARVLRRIASQKHMLPQRGNIRGCGRGGQVMPKAFERGYLHAIQHKGPFVIGEDFAPPAPGGSRSSTFSQSWNNAFVFARSNLRALKGGTPTPPSLRMPLRN